MGVAEYYGMAPIWKEHDELCVKMGSEIPYVDVNSRRSRSYLVSKVQAS
jgi:hypothetical protein